MAGRNFSQIAEALGCSKSVAYDAVQRALAADTARIADQREQYRQLHLERLERMLTAQWAPAVRGEEVEVVKRDAFGAYKLDPATGDPIVVTVRKIDQAAVDRVLRIMERQARLLGLDAPVRVAVSADVQTQLTDMIGDIERMLAGEVLDVEGEEVDPIEDPAGT